MIISEELTIAIARIQQMESYLDKVLEILASHSQSEHDIDNLKETIKILTDYYENGLWLSDYERDEKGELPPDLKRGILAQDTLYNLLCDMQSFYKGNEESYDDTKQLRENA